MRSILVVCLLAGPAMADSNTEVHLGGAAGGGRVELMGERYSSMDLGVDLGARRWVSPQVGLGIRLGFVAAEPFATAMAPDGRAMSRQIPTASAGSLFAGGTVSAYHVTGFLGMRASSNGAGDRDLELVVDVGATF